MTGIFITARMGSQRLPGKHLMKVANKMFIEWILARLYHEFDRDILSSACKLFLVTSSTPDNVRFEESLKSNHPNLSFFYGSDANIPLRHWECAQANSIESIVNVDGDDVLCSVHAVRAVASALRLEQKKMVKTAGLPLGMNCLGYSTALLGACLKNYRDKEKLETGWGKIFEEGQVLTLSLGEFLDPKLRFTLDYDEDRKFFQTLIEHFGERIISVSDEELIQFVLDKQVYLENHFLNTNYWQNFNSQRAAE